MIQHGFHRIGLSEPLSQEKKKKFPPSFTAKTVKSQKSFRGIPPSKTKVQESDYCLSQAPLSHTLQGCNISWFVFKT
jgi:hypothetical protein